MNRVAIIILKKIINCYRHRHKRIAIAKIECTEMQISFVRMVAIFFPHFLKNDNVNTMVKLIYYDFFIEKQKKKTIEQCSTDFSLFFLDLFYFRFRERENTRKMISNIL